MTDSEDIVDRLRAARDAARDEALEEAARIVDTWPADTGLHEVNMLIAERDNRIASWIRALANNR